MESNGRGTELKPKDDNDESKVRKIWRKMRSV